MTVRVVLVEDHALFRAGVRSELTESRGRRPSAADRDRRRGGRPPKTPSTSSAPPRPTSCCSTSTSQAAAGSTVITAVRDDPAPPRFLALSVSDAADDVIAVVRAGARGYVTKTIDAAELVDAVAARPRRRRRVLAAPRRLRPRRLLRRPPGARRSRARPAHDPRAGGAAPHRRGYTYKEIAARLHLSVKTIETHVSAVLRKLQLSNRHQLTAWANERRLI